MSVEGLETVTRGRLLYLGSNIEVVRGLTSLHQDYDLHKTPNDFKSAGLLGSCLLRSLPQPYGPSHSVPHTSTLPQLYSVPRPTSMELPDPTEKVRQYIDEALRATVRELSSPDGRPSITIRRRYHKHSTFFVDPDTQALEATESNTQVTYSWPGKDVHEAWRFSKLIRAFYVMERPSLSM